MLQCSRHLPPPEATRRDHLVLPVYEGRERNPDRSPTEVSEDGGGGHQATVPTMKTKEISFDAEALVAGVEAMSDHVRGERKLTLRGRTLLPSPLKPLAAQDVLEIRQRLNVSQAVFASLLNVSKVTAISWEKGRRRPSGAALRLLELARRRPEVFQEV